MEESILIYITLPVILTTIGGLAAVSLGFLTSRYKKNLPSWVALCNVAVGLVILFSGFLSSINQGRFQKSLANQSKELVEKSSKIETLQMKLSSILTGGDSFACVDVTIAKDPVEDYLEFNLFHRGEFPVYDLKVEVLDQDYSRELLHRAKAEGIPLTLQYFDKAKKSMSFGTVGPGKRISGWASFLMPSNVADRNFLIKIDSRYDQLYQNIHVHRNSDGRLSFDTMVKRGDKVIYSSGDIHYFEKSVGDHGAHSSRNTQNLTGPVAIITGIPGKRWTLKDQGETLTLMALEGCWYAFDARGKLIEPEILK